MADEDIFLEVEEENNPRHSFDINIYDAELTLGEIQSLLWQAEALSADDDREPADSAASNKPLRHISGGESSEVSSQWYFGWKDVRSSY